MIQSRTYSRLVARSLLAAALVFGLATPMLAQTGDGGTDGTGTAVASKERQEIQARVSQLQSQLATAKGDDAAAINAELVRLRHRLTEGDFQPGDVIALNVLGEPALSDTFVVEAPHQLRLPNLDPIDLTGVLRSEIEPYLTDQLSRYVRDPQVRASALVRVGILGAVSRPGFYTVPPKTTVSNIFAAAGGFGKDAKIQDIRVERLGQRVVNADLFRQAMIAGWSVQDLGIQAGDQVVVPAGSGMKARDYVIFASGLVGLTWGIVRILGHI